MSRRWVYHAVGLPLLLVTGAVYLQARPEQAVSAQDLPRRGGDAAQAASTEQALLSRYCRRTALGPNPGVGHQQREFRQDHGRQRRAVV